MTPLIQELISLSADEAVQFQWFDATYAMNKEVEVNPEILATPMPFPMTALAFKQVDGLKVLLMIKSFEQKANVTGWLVGEKQFKRLPSFTYTASDAGIQVAHLDGSSFDYRTSIATNCVAAICSFLLSLQSRAVQSYAPLRRANHEKRIRQGKTPMYDWKTITVEPPQPKSVSRGGTHASPRWHERRGHFRVTKKGSRVWVSNCVVGKASEGAVFHDYIFQPATN
jgi:hypothetical protein